MKNRLLPLRDKLLLRKRALIETTNDRLKNTSQIEHTRHRSLRNFLGNVAAGLIVSTWREKKPNLNIPSKNSSLSRTFLSRTGVTYLGTMPLPGPYERAHNKNGVPALLTAGPMPDLYV